MTRFDEPNSAQRMKLKVIFRDPVDKSNSRSDGTPNAWLFENRSLFEKQ